jgi:putative peptide zinc metalloprotease protein
MPRTFSDQWYRISDLRVALRPGISVRLHEERGEPWYVFHERAHAGFFRVNPATYRFISLLNVDATLDAVWRASLQTQPEETPGQEEVFELIVALYRANLIYVEGGVDESKILDRFQRKKAKPFLTRMSEVLFMRIPLWDPDAWLHRHRAHIDRVFSKPVRWLALLVFAWAVVEFILAGSRAWQQASNILQLNNLLLLYLAVFVSHVLHELSHAAMCKYFGGEVRTMGVMLLLLTPLPYVDLSSSWTFRDKYQRAWVDSAGMLSDAFLGAVATLVWAYSPPGVVNELAYNLMFSTAVYTVLFNINPLMRFDGYYILADLVQIPNLHEKARQQFLKFWREHVLQVPPLEDEPVAAKERWGLLGFFITSNLYRLMVMTGIVLFVADQYFGVGLLVAVALALTSFVQPLMRMLAPLKNPLFLFQHKRLVRRSGLVLAALLVLVLVVPMPDSRVLDGVVEARQYTPLYTESGGVVVQAHVPNGQWVEAGTLLVTLQNPELETEIEGVQAQLTMAKTQEGKALTEGSVDLLPIRERALSLQAVLHSLLVQREALVVRAPHAGVWVDQESKVRQQAWMARGAELGRVVDDRSQVFFGVIRQEAATALLGLEEEESRVRIEGERHHLHTAQRFSLVPHSQSTLPSAALSPLAGGSVAVSTADPSGKQAVEAFFLLRAELSPEAGRSVNDPLRHGRAGWIKIRLPARPLALQAWRAATQYFQRRYKL